jgi:hypothetical protein
MDTVSLKLIFEQLEPADLLGMRLLAGQPHLVSAPGTIPRDQLIAAVTEIIAYTERCARAAGSLSGLRPIPLTTLSIAEFGL